MIRLAGKEMIMNMTKKIPLLKATWTLLLLAAALGAMSGQMAYSQPPHKREPLPLIDTVRHATAKFRDINVALYEGWAPATPCVSGPDAGAMGVHFNQPNRKADGSVTADAPQFLIYEPLPDGAMRLVGVEFLVTVSDWEGRNGAVPAVLDGNLMNLVSSPNRFGLPPFYELHVWAWENNPQGSFADWNTRVNCDKETG
jgi:hypothetical protein